MASPDFKQFLDLCNYLPDLNGLGPAIKTEQKEHLMMCCQTPTPPLSPCSHHALKPHTSGTSLPEPDRAVFSPLERQFFRAPTVLTGILPGNRAQASGLWRRFSSFSGQGLSPVETTLPYESWPCLLCRHQPCSSTGSSLPTCQLTCNMPFPVSHTARSHCQASLQCPRARPPLRHPPTTTTAGPGQEKPLSIAFPPCKPHFLFRLIYTLWSFHPLSSLTTQVFELAWGWGRERPP